MNDTTKQELADPTEPKVDTTALALLAKAEIDSQIATAHAFPRGMSRFIREATELVAMDQATAESCIYSLPRGKNADGTKKLITGASIRFAEIIQSCYGNNRSGGRVVAVDHATLTAQGVFHDLEKNVMITKEVSRPILDSQGRRYKADMINVTGNAAISVAMRNAILAGIPQAIWGLVYEKVQEVAVGTVVTLAERRANAIAWFGKVGISPEQIFGKLDVEGEADIGLDELEQLIGLKTAIKDRSLTPEAAFAPDQKEGADTSSLATAVAAKRAGKPMKAPEDSGAPVLTLNAALERLHAATTLEELDAVAADFSLIQKATDKLQAQMLYDTKVIALK